MVGLFLAAFRMTQALLGSPALLQLPLPRTDLLQAALMAWSALLQPAQKAWLFLVALSRAPVPK